jgi:probable phosphoglycerate mutase
MIMSDLPPRRRIYLMRHADVAYFEDPTRPVAAEEVALTPDGPKQAREAGRALAMVQFDRVLTSGLPRTNETARLVVAELEHPPADLVFHEWPDLQDFRGGEVDEIPDVDLEISFLGPFRGIPPQDAAYLGGETVSSLVERVGAAMERLFADRAWQTILLVAHAGVNRAILSWVLAGRGQYFAHFEQSPGCINIIDGEPEGFVIRAVNLLPYNPVHLGIRRTALEEILEQYRAYRQAM